VQPRGPYYVGGVCLGGVIAFEMAQQLQDAAETVAAVVLIDSYVPGTPRHLPARTLRYGFFEQADWYLGDLMMLSYPDKFRYIGQRIRNISARFMGLARSLGAKVIPSWNVRISTPTRNMERVKRANSEAWGQYVPRRYSGRLMLLWCSEVATRCYRDRRLAWSELADSGLEVHTIPGNHLTMVEAPHVSVMAETLKRYLFNAQAAAQNDSAAAGAHAG
jgi:thioesterase domain-containing protein